MLVGQRRAVQAVRDEDLGRPQHEVQRQALGVAVAGGEGDQGGAGLDAGKLQHRLERGPAELAGADLVPADVVADALQRHVLGLRWQGAEGVELQPLGVVDEAMEVQRPAGGVDDRVDEVLRDDIEVFDRCQLGRDSAQTAFGRGEDGAVPARHQLSGEHRQRGAGHRQWCAAQEPAAARVGGRRGRVQPAVVRRLENGSVDKEEEGPEKRCGEPLGEPEQAVAAQRKEQHGHHQPAHGAGGEAQMRAAGPLAEEPEQPPEDRQRRHHREDQAGLLDDLAGVLQAVDEEAEKRARHRVENRLLEQLRQGTQPRQWAEQVHQRDQHRPRGGARGEAAPELRASHSTAIVGGRPVGDRGLNLNPFLNRT